MSEGTASAGSELATAVTTALLADAVNAGMPVSDDVAQQITERVGAVSEPSETAAQTTAQTADDSEETDDEFEFPSLEAFEIDEDDDEDDDEIALPPVSVETDDDDDEYAYEDEEKRELRRQLKAAQKEAEHAKQLRLQEAHRKWRSKMESQYRFADWDTVTGDSRRSFERAAKASHNNNLKIVAPILEQAKGALARERESLRAQVEAEVQAAWGRPTTGPGASTVTAGNIDQELAEARQSGNLQKVLSVLRKREGR